MRPARIGGLVSLILGTAVAWAGSSALHEQAQQYATAGKPAAAQQQMKKYSDALGAVALGELFVLATLGAYALAGNNPEQERRRAEIDRQIYSQGLPPSV